MREVPVVTSLVSSILVLAASLLFLARPVSAHSGDVLSAFAAVTPTIDGVVSLGEWDDAANVSFFLVPDRGIGLSTLYVKNDGTNLYLALVIRDEDFDTGDLARFHFDNDHDGVRDIGDDAINCFGVNTCRDDFRFDELNNEQIDAAFGGTNDVVSAASHTNPIADAVGDYVFEISHPFNTSDDSHDISLSAGDTVGLGVEFFDSGIGSGWFPSFPTTIFPTLVSWADIVIAQQVVQVGIDIKPDSEPNCISLNNAGVIPVAILSSEDFDATAVDGSTVFLSSAPVKLAGTVENILCHEEDVSGATGEPDGLLDLVCQIETAEFMLEPGSATAVLEGQTFDGISIRGEDEVCIVSEN